MNFIVRFLDHQIGYGYLAAGAALQANRDAILAAAAPLVGQGAAGLKAAVAQVLGKDGVLGLEVEQIVDRGIDNLDANALANIEADLPGAFDKAVAAIEAHGHEMLAA